MRDLPIQPEGPESEWKERPPSAFRLARTLAAFHNGVGGRLWIGVADDGVIVGLEDLEEAELAVEQAARLVTPRPGMDLFRHRSQGLPILEVRVAAGEPPALVQRGGASVLYVRDGASTRPASAASTRRMTRGEARRIQLDRKEKRLLLELSRRGPIALPELAKAARMGRRNTRRSLVKLLQAGLVHEDASDRFSLTPAGHRRV